MHLCYGSRVPKLSQSPEPVDILQIIITSNTALISTDSS